MLKPIVTPKNWQTLKYHAYADLFPLLEGKEFDGLLEDIQRNGFDVDRPIVLYEGMILDGRNRFLACVRLNECDETCVEPEFASYELFAGDMSAIDWVVSTNLHRRHLTTGQRTAIAAEIANMKRGDNQHTEVPSIEGTSISQAAAAKLMNVSVASVEREAVVRQERPDLHSEVKSGRKSVNEAYREAKGQNDEEKPFDAAKVVKSLTAKYTLVQLELVHDALSGYLFGRTI